MDVIALTRALVDIPSVTPDETAVGEYLARNVLGPLASAHGGTLETFHVETGRRNILASFGDPIVTLSTHIDTVPPYIPSHEDDTHVWGRGSCDAKGILACMICAAKRLLEEGVRGIAVLAVVGEERNSAGARHAATIQRGSRWLINGEPTENRLASATKGSLRYELHAKGRCAHSAYPHLGDSAINKLLDVLDELRRMPLPHDELLGPSTLNIGTLRGGRAPNVIPDEAMAEVHIRLVDDGNSIRQAVAKAAEGKVEAREILCIPAVRLKTLPGFESEVMAYTTDIPAFNGAWGEPLLLGPGTIHVAHTADERVSKAELHDAVDIYCSVVKQLINL